MMKTYQIFEIRICIILRKIFVHFEFDGSDICQKKLRRATMGWIPVIFGFSGIKKQ